MKAHTIGKVIKAKMEEWLNTLPLDLAREVKGNIVVTGGCITSMFLQEKVNDYDVYFTTQRTALLVAAYYAGKFDNKGNPPMVAIFLEEVAYSKFEGLSSYISNTGGLQANDYHYTTSVVIAEPRNAHELLPNMDNGDVRNVGIHTQHISSVIDEASSEEEAAEILAKKDTEVEAKGEKYAPIYMTTNAITLSHGVQLVLRFTGAVGEIHKNYDFVHATNYWTFKTGLVTNAKALECILAKELCYVGSRYPLASIMRTRKFIKRGWTCHAGNYIKMAMQLNELDLKNIQVLTDQLTGVDQAFMWQIVDALNSKKKSTPSFEFNATYVCELADAMMNFGHGG